MSSMGVFIHGVAEIRAKASSSPIVFLRGPGLSHTQDLEFLDDDGKVIGKITIFLKSADAAIPFGDSSELIRDDPVLLESD